MFNESEYCGQVIEKELNKILAMTKTEILGRIFKNFQNVGFVKNRIKTSMWK